MTSRDYSLKTVFDAVDRFTRPVRRMRTAMQRFGKAAEKTLQRANRMSDRFLKGLRRIGLAAAAAGAAIGAMAVNIIRTGADFEQSLVNAAAKFPGEIRQGTEAFDALQRKAQEVGGTTEFTAQQAAEGLNFLAMAGFSAEQAIEALPGVVDLATAAQVELGTASDFATDSLGAFNLMAEDAVQLQTNLARVSDVMAKTTTRANTSFEDLFEAYKKAGPVATAAGAEIEETSALLALLANAGFKGAEGGTALRNAYLGVTAASGSASGLVRKFVGEIDDGSGGVISMTEVIRRLNTSMAGLTDKEKIGALTKIFGKRAVGPFLTLMASGSEEVEKLNLMLQGATGTADEMADTMRDTLSGDLKGLESAVESVKIAVFDLQSGAIRDLVQGMTDWVRANKDVIATKVDEFIGKVRDNLPEIVTWLKRIGVAVGVLTAMAVAVKVAATAFAFFRGVLLSAKAAIWLVKGAWLLLNGAFALSPIGLVAVAIGAVVAALVLFHDEIFAFLGRVAKPFEDWWQGWIDKAAAIHPWLGSILKVLGKMAKIVLNPFGAIKEGAEGFARMLGFQAPDESEYTTAPASGPMSTPPEIVSPQDRAASALQSRETVVTERAELTIRDETGRAEMTKPPPKMSGAGIALERSGAP